MFKFKYNNYTIKFSHKENKIGNTTQYINRFTDFNIKNKLIDASLITENTLINNQLKTNSYIKYDIGDINILSKIILTFIKICKKDWPDELFIRKGCVLLHPIILPIRYNYDVEIDMNLLHLKSLYNSDHTIDNSVYDLVGKIKSILILQ